MSKDQMRPPQRRILLAAADGPVQTKPTARQAVLALVRKGYVEVREDGVHLTDAGRARLGEELRPVAHKELNGNWERGREKRWSR